MKACHRLLLSFFNFLLLKIISKQSGYSLDPRSQNLKIATKKLACSYIYKYFATNSTCNESFWVNNICKVLFITSKP